MKHGVHAIRLANGARGLIIDVPDSKMVGFNLSFRAGSYFCPPEKVQLAHFMEHIICTANEKYTEEQFIAEIGKNGAYTNAFTSPDNISYVAYCAEFEWERILKLFLLAITKPKFLEEHFSREREVIRQELTNSLTNYGLQLLLAQHREINRFDYMTKHGLDSLQKIALADLKDFYRKTHYVQNLRFLIAGNLSSKIEKIKGILSGIELPESEQSRLRPFESPLAEVNGPIGVQNPEVDKFYFDILAIRPGGWNYREWIAVDLLADCLFGYGGIGSLKARITGPARERGLIYSIGGGPFDFHGNLSVGCRGRVEEAKAEELLKLVTSEIDRLRQGQLTDGEFRELKDKATGSEALKETTVSGLMGHYGVHFLKNEEVVDYDIYLKLLPTIKREDVLETLESVLSENKWYFGLLGAKADERKKGLYEVIGSTFSEGRGRGLRKSE